MAEYDIIDELIEPTDEELRRLEEESEDLGQIDLSAPPGTSIDDPVMMYLQEIAKVPPLTAEEEEKLTVRISNGDEEAKSRLTEAYLPLVVSIARQYVDQGVLFQDLIQEGTLGLMEAVDRFDAQSGCKFKTYAYWWIRQAIMQTIEEQTETTRISDHVVETANKQAEVSMQLTRELGRAPRVEEIAGRMDISVGEVEEIRKISESAASQRSDADEKESGRSEDTAKETSQDETKPDPSETAQQKMIKKQLDAAMSSLTEQEQKVLRMRYGLDDGRARSQEEVGEALGLHGDDVRQIEADAMEKLQRADLGRR